MESKKILETIVLVHGLAGNRFVMMPLAHRLRKRGFRVEIWSYNSFRGSVALHAKRFFDYLTSTLADRSSVHIVAHSLGTIVTRSALGFGEVKNLGRLVFFAPPSTGTPVARRASPYFGRIIRTVPEMSDSQESFVNALPRITGAEVGIVAAEYDFLVPETHTHLPEEKEHVQIKTTHASMLLSKIAADLSESFITTGSFNIIPQESLPTVKPNSTLA